MATELARTQFDYGDAGAKEVKRCEAAIERIDAKQRRMANDIVAIGKELLAVKASLPHGLFGGWLAHHFGWSHKTACRMMEAAQTFGKIDNLSNLTIDQSALYLLASDQCDDDTRQELLERAEQGERITHEMVRRALEPEPEPTEADNDSPEEDDDSDDEDQAEAVSHGTCGLPVAEDYDEDEGVEIEIHQPTGPSSDLDSWNLGRFILDSRRYVNRWLTVCPQEEREEMATVLRDLAAQVEGGQDWTEEGQ